MVSDEVDTKRFEITASPPRCEAMALPRRQQVLEHVGRALVRWPESVTWNSVVT